MRRRGRNGVSPPSGCARRRRNWRPWTVTSRLSWKGPSWWPAPRCWPPVFINTSAVNGESDVADNAPVNDAAQKAKEELAALLRRAEKGDQTTLPALRKLLEAPSMVDALGGDLARQAQL